MKSTPRLTTAEERFKILNWDQTDSAYRELEEVSYEINKQNHDVYVTFTRTTEFEEIVYTFTGTKTLSGRILP